MSLDKITSRGTAKNTGKLASQGSKPKESVASSQKAKVESKSAAVQESLFSSVAKSVIEEAAGARGPLGDPRDPDRQGGGPAPTAIGNDGFKWP